MSKKHSLKWLMVATALTALLACDGSSNTQHHKVNLTPKTGYGEAYNKARRLNSDVSGRNRELENQAGSVAGDE